MLAWYDTPMHLGHMTADRRLVDLVFDFLSLIDHGRKLIEGNGRPLLLMEGSVPLHSTEITLADLVAERPDRTTSGGLLTL